MSPPQDSRSDNQKQLILVVEDNIEMNRFLCEIFSREYRTESAFNGKEGLEKATKLCPDLIVTDIAMPEMTGDQMFHAIKSIKELESIPFIILSSSTDNDVRIRLLKEGAQDYVNKPFVIEEIWARARNILAAKFAENVIKASEAKFRGLLETAFDPVIIVNSKGNIEFCNQQTKTLFGYEANELLGKPIEVLVPERFREIHAGDRNQHNKHPKSRPMGRNLDLMARKKDGSEVPVDISLTPYRTEHDLIVTAFIRDMTAHKRIENQQRFLAETSQILAETMDYQERVERIANFVVPRLADLCIVHVLDGDRLVQKAVSPENVNGSFPIDPKSIGQDGKWGPAWIVQTKRSQLVEGIKETLSYIGVPMIVRGKTTGVISFFRSKPARYSQDDLFFAELVAFRSALAVDNAKLYEETQNAVTLREEILGIVSHDLKNPLSSIRLQYQLIPRVLRDSKDREKIEKISAAAERSAGQMERMIGDLLDFSKIQSGTLSLEEKNHEAALLVEDGMKTVQDHAEKKNVQIKAEVTSGLPVIHCDSDRILQVFSNLLSNAIKFTPEHGSVTLRGTSNDSEIIFSVIDYGTGIPKEDLPTVFDKHWQAKKTASLGAGLGLFITKGIIENHGGRIWVESEVGMGTAFHFTLPLRKRETPD